jgi:hypothetical protein
VVVKFIRKVVKYNRIKVGRNVKKRKKHFLFPMLELGVKIPTKVLVGLLIPKYVVAGRGKVAQMKKPYTKVKV